MRVKLIDWDSKIPNLALMKISQYHKKSNNIVGFDIKNPDKIYISSIFEKNKDDILNYINNYDCDVEFGGIYLDKELPKNIEYLKPDYDLYPSQYSQGYTTRGCNKKCTYCIVNKKEGKIKRHQHIKEFHDKKFDTCMVMDNNWLYDYKWFKDNANYLIENKIKVKEHGMDTYQLDNKRAELLSKIKHDTYKFAFDNIKDEKSVIKSINILRNNNINLRSKVLYYVLVGYNTTPEEDLYRVNLLRENGTSPYIMRYKKDPFLNKLARWCNAPQLFYSFNSLEEYYEKITKSNYDKELKEYGERVWLN